MDEAEQSIEIYKRRAYQLFADAEDRDTENYKMKILLENSGRLDQTRALSGFPNSKEFDFSRSNELKF